jgi:hypothetical protein
MNRTRKDLRRWVMFPAFVALISTTSVLAETTVRNLAWSDAADHLFRCVADPGANARPTSGTVTESASQARTAARIDRADAATTRASTVSSTLSGTLTQPAGDPSPRGPEVRDVWVLGTLRELPAQPASLRSVGDSAAEPRSAELREIRRLREEIRSLKMVVTNLQARSRRGRALQPAALRTAR